ncbi:hypothetical protein E2C01_021683 [Portunus trituberculatus]|uniref:Uncharacterized protein n=1 Tax=Portunus trituberculatus TaxID=210409 RepID=A0A5B7E558_PORTR|nr:hypothetical protein [Portunus trituberculatus]
MLLGGLIAAILFGTLPGYGGLGATHRRRRHSDVFLHTVRRNAGSRFFVGLPLDTSLQATHSLWYYLDKKAQCEGHHTMKTKPAGSNAIAP